MHSVHWVGLYNIGREYNLSPRLSPTHVQFLCITMHTWGGEAGDETRVCGLVTAQGIVVLIGKHDSIAGTNIYLSAVGL